MAKKIVIEFKDDALYDRVVAHLKDEKGSSVEAIVKMSLVRNAIEQELVQQRQAIEAEFLPEVI